MEQDIYCVVDTTEEIFIVFFTDIESAQLWSKDDTRPGDYYLGPYSVSQQRKTPFDIVIVSNTDAEPNIILRDEYSGEYGIKHVSGPFTVYDSITEYEMNFEI